MKAEDKTSDSKQETRDSAKTPQQSPQINAESHQVNIVGYLRKSTDEADRQVYSLEAQRKAIVDTATMKGWGIAQKGFYQPRRGKGRSTGDGMYVDEGISGTIFNRPALAMMRKDAKRTKDFELILMVDFDRIARDNADAALIRKELAEYGVRVAETSAPDMDSSSATGKLIYGIKGVVAEFERSLLVERVKRGMAIGKAQGKKMGRPPAGYEVTTNKGFLILSPIGEKTVELLKANPKLTAPILQRELGLTKYKEAYDLLDSIKKNNGASQLGKPQS